MLMLNILSFVADLVNEKTSLPFHPYVPPNPITFEDPRCFSGYVRPNQFIQQNAHKLHEWYTITCCIIHICLV